MSMCAMAKPRMDESGAVLIKLMALYRALEYSLSKIEVQKLCYFAQEGGQALRLNFGKNQYGPYAPNLRHVLNHIDGHCVEGVGDHDRAETELQLVAGVETEADSFLTDHPDSLERMERVGALIESFETPFGMELLATVHWVATRQCKSDDFECILAGVRNWEPERPEWNRRKSELMSEAQIRAAYGRLKDQGWLPAS
ncbi:MAG: hypothetical protein AAGI48_13010 [Verrucomicrobiota bacterium]